MNWLLTPYELFPSQFIPDELTLSSQIDSILTSKTLKIVLFSRILSEIKVIF